MKSALARLLDNLREEDVVVVARLDRLVRSTRDLLDIAERLREADAGLHSLAKSWTDTEVAAVWILLAKSGRDWQEGGASLCGMSAAA